MIIKWTKRLKDRFGWRSAKELSIVEVECLKRSCFHPHDWHHDSRLVCLENARFGCPDWAIKEMKR